MRMELAGADNPRYRSESRSLLVRRFPLHRIALMLVALLAFARFWYVSHQSPASPPSGRPASPVAPVPSAPVATECRTLDRALESALRAPEDARAVSDARRQLGECAHPPSRACELGTALAARAPLAAGASPLRELLGDLCGRCGEGQNTCADAVGRGLLESAAGRPPDLAELHWSLEHAGPTTATTCERVIGSTLGAAAVTEGTLSRAVLDILQDLAPLCAKGNHLPAAVLNAAAVQQGRQAPVLATLAVRPAGTTQLLKPDHLTGALNGTLAFDGDAATGVPLKDAARTVRWDADGALRAEYAPPLKQVASLRIRAKGAGSVRAIVRTPRSAGMMEDPERGFAFVNPTVCRFQGTGAWEDCPLVAPLLDVDGLSVFPERSELVLNELEVVGAR
ncbi:hypothetical protein JGU66_17185 [Myxococcaceae bacterium JPH2]|nr:hypothetical protein [Myxococcaceae bacterium JPH2]